MGRSEAEAYLPALCSFPPAMHMVTGWLGALPRALNLPAGSAGAPAPCWCKGWQGPRVSSLTCSLAHTFPLFLLERHGGWLWSADTNSG